MHDPAFIALACSLGPVAYLLAGFLTTLAAVKVFGWKFEKNEDVIGIGLSPLIWPLIMCVFLPWWLGLHIGKLVGKVLNN